MSGPDMNRSPTDKEHIMSNTVPLAQEYANSTETNLDKSKPGDLGLEKKPQVQTGASADPMSGKNKAREEHPISVGKP